MKALRGVRPLMPRAWVPLLGVGLDKVGVENHLHHLDVFIPLLAALNSEMLFE
jgi:hypothetical protein